MEYIVSRAKTHDFRHVEELIARKSKAEPSIFLPLIRVFSHLLRALNLPPLSPLQSAPSPLPSPLSPLPLPSSSPPLPPLGLDWAPLARNRSGSCIIVCVLRMVEVRHSSVTATRRPERRASERGCRRRALPVSDGRAPGARGNTPRTVAQVEGYHGRRGRLERARGS